MRYSLNITKLNLLLHHLLTSSLCYFDLRSHLFFYPAFAAVQHHVTQQLIQHLWRHYYQLIGVWFLEGRQIIGFHFTRINLLLHHLLTSSLRYFHLRSKLFFYPAFEAVQHHVTQQLIQHLWRHYYQLIVVYFLMADIL